MDLCKESRRGADFETSAVARKQEYIDWIDQSYRRRRTSTAFLSAEVSFLRVHLPSEIRFDNSSRPSALIFACSIFRDVTGRAVPRRVRDTFTAFSSVA